MRAFITGADVRNGSLTGRDVRNRSLTAADLAPGVLRAGPQGAAGLRAFRARGRERCARAGPRRRDARARARRPEVGENGEALRAALASITDASQTKPYVIQLAPGVYEPRWHDAGHEASRVDRRRRSNRDADHRRPGAGQLRRGAVIGADGTLLRDVTVTNRGDMGGNSHYVMVVPGGARDADRGRRGGGRTAGARGFPLIARGGSSVDVRDSRLETDSLEPAIAFYVTEGSRRTRPRLRARRRGATAGTRACAAGLPLDRGGRDEHAREQGSAAVQASAQRRDGRRVARRGRRPGSVTCVASYNGNFAPLGANCA